MQTMRDELRNQRNERTFNRASEPGMWVPDRLDVTEPEARVFGRNRDHVRMCYRYRLPDGQWEYKFLDNVKRRPVDENRFNGTFYDDHPHTLEFHGVYNTDAVERYQARLARWKQRAAEYQATPDSDKDTQRGRLLRFESFIMDSIADDQNWYERTCHRDYGAILRKGSWFWCVVTSQCHIWVNEDTNIIEGWAATEEEALQKARESLLATCPRDCVGIHDNRVAKRRYKNTHAKKTNHKDWTKAAKGTVWEGRAALWTYRDGNYGSSSSWTPRPIVNLTDKYVYVLSNTAMTELSWRGVPVTTGRFQRDDYIRLSRDELETEGRAYHHDEYHSFYAEPNFSSGQWEWDAESRCYECTAPHNHDELKVIAGDLATAEQDLKNIRRIMQREHPDKGGDVHKFLQAQVDLGKAKSMLKSLRQEAA